MKKTKLIRVRNLDPNPQAKPEPQSQHEIDSAEFGESISVESTKVTPTKINNEGFIPWRRRLRPTRDGMESEVEKPLLIAKSGHRVKENEIKGQCEVCEGYDSFIFNCNVYGCKRSLCLKHVYFFELEGNKTPYCLEHYRRAVDEYDTWKEDNRRRQ